MNKKIAIIVVCVILVVISVCTVLFSKKENGKDNTIDNEVVENILNENEIEPENIAEENKVENEVVEPIQTEPNTGTSVVPSSAIYESNSDVGTTDKKQQAIDLVKNYWGEDSDATYRCDYVDSNGEYIIAISSMQTASIKGYFRVNLENKTVDIEY